MPKHTYTELVAAGAPELPVNYGYKIERHDDAYGVTAGSTKGEEWSQPVGFSYLFGPLNLRNIVNACRNAYNDLTEKLNMQKEEEEWLGVYK